jgi:alpha-ribazole phosphatase/probable phosphoglycerate mutase
LRRDGFAVGFSSDLARAAETAGRTRDFLAELALDWDGRKVLLVAHSANRWALATLLAGVPLEDQVDAPFAWPEGWPYLLPTGWNGR